MRFPIDVRNLTFIAGSDPAGVMDMEGRQRSDKATGELLCGLDLVALGGEDGAGVIGYGFAGEPKGISTGQPLRVEGLTAMTGGPSWRQLPGAQARRGRAGAKGRCGGVRDRSWQGYEGALVGEGCRRGEGELRYPRQRKDHHPLAREDKLLDTLAELETHGLVTSELTFRLTPEGRARLAGLGAGGRRGRMNSGQVAPDIGGVVRTVVIVVAVLFFGWLLLAWAVSSVRSWRYRSRRSRAWRSLLRAGTPNGADHRKLRRTHFGPEGGQETG